MHRRVADSHDRAYLDSRSHMDRYRRAHLDTRADLDT